MELTWLRGHGSAQTFDVQLITRRRKRTDAVADPFAIDTTCAPQLAELCDDVNSSERNAVVSPFSIRLIFFLNMKNDVCMRR